MRVLQNILLLCMGVGCLFGGGIVRDHVIAARDEIAGATAIGLEARDPQIVLLTHLLGGFKGVVVDLIGMRAVRLQQDGEFWELYQLYNWMGKLEPHIERIWVFNGWNMSYNLATELKSSEARWRWIERGLHYLRSEGLKHNPQSGQIMGEIARILHHKIGRVADLHHRYYKHRFALDMNSLFGDREMQDMAGVVQAPATLEELLNIPEVAACLSEFDLDAEQEPISNLDLGQGIFWIPRPVHQALFRKKPRGMEYGDFMSTPEGQPARKVLNYVVAQALRKRLNMQRLDVAYELEKKYGKMDWRLPEPHVMYWARLAGMSDRTDQNQIKYDRLLMFSLKQFMRRGNIGYMDPSADGAFITTYDLSKIRPVHDLYLEMIDKHSRGTGLELEVGNSIRDGHEQFLKRAGHVLYFAGYKEVAEFYFRYMQTQYHKPEAGVSMKEYYLGRLSTVIDKDGSPEEVQNTINAMIYRAILAYYVGDIEEARVYENLSKAAWDSYLQYDAKHSRGVERHEDRKMLPTWQDLHREVLRKILLGQTPCPQWIIDIIRQQHRIRPGAEKTFVPPGSGIAPPVPPSSPEPK